MTEEPWSVWRTMIDPRGEILATRAVVEWTMGNNAPFAAHRPSGPDDVMP